MEEILLDTMFELPGLDGVEEVVINREVAESAANPLYIYADRRGRIVAPEPRVTDGRECDLNFEALRCIARQPICDLTGGRHAHRAPSVPQRSS